MRQHGAETERLAGQGHLAVLDFRDVQHVVDQPEQMVRCVSYLFQRLGNFLAIVRIAPRKLQRSQNHVHRRADLVAHAREELGLCSIRRLGNVHRILHGQLDLLVGRHVAHDHEQLRLIFERQPLDRVRSPAFFAGLLAAERELPLLEALRLVLPNAIEQSHALGRKPYGGRQPLVLQKGVKAIADDAFGLRHNGSDLAVGGRIEVHRHIDAVGQRLVQLAEHGDVLFAQAAAVRAEHQQRHHHKAGEDDGEHRFERGGDHGSFGTHVLDGHHVAHVPIPVVDRRDAHITGFAVYRGREQPRLLVRHNVAQRGKVAPRARLHELQGSFG